MFLNLYNELLSQKVMKLMRHSGILGGDGCITKYVCASMTQEFSEALLGTEASFSGCCGLLALTSVK